MEKGLCVNGLYYKGNFSITFIKIQTGGQGALLEFSYTWSMLGLHLRVLETWKANKKFTEVLFGSINLLYKYHINLCVISFYLLVFTNKLREI